MPLTGQIPSKNTSIGVIKNTQAAKQQLLDLGDVFQCNGCLQLNTNNKNNPNAFAATLYASVDNTNWTTVFSNVVGDVNAPQKNFTSITARYFAYQVTSLTLGSADSIGGNLFIVSPFQ